MASRVAATEPFPLVPAINAAAQSVVRIAEQSKQADHHLEPEVDSRQTRAIRHVNERTIVWIHPSGHHLGPRLED